MRSRPIKPGSNEYAWDRKHPVFESDKGLLFFSNGNYSVSNIIVGQLFVCLSDVGYFVTSWNRFFCCANLSFMLPLVFDLLLQFVLSLTSTSYFLYFLLRLKKIAGINYFGLVFIGLMSFFWVLSRETLVQHFSPHFSNWLYFYQSVC